MKIELTLWMWRLMRLAVGALGIVLCWIRPQQWVLGLLLAALSIGLLLRGKVGASNNENIEQTRSAGARRAHRAIEIEQERRHRGAEY